jgi:hypothetical protein
MKAAANRRSPDAMLGSQMVSRREAFGLRLLEHRFIKRHRIICNTPNK